MRIGILGGTFNPIHLGHLYLARKVLDKLSLEKIIFIPTYLPPHKKNTGITEIRHRYSMVRLAIAGNRSFEVSDIEIKRKGRSYSVETLRQIRKRHGDSAEIFFITGSDSLKELDSWKGLKEILMLSRFVIVKRPGFAIRNISRDFIMLDVDAKDISASSIRKMIKKGEPISGVVPKEVVSYIKRHGLYGYGIVKNI
ncbi:MAG: nicotinate-nucleotide adenylyltransferase [Candidatus Omnitrophota bacterium]